VVTRRALLDACDAVARTRLSVARGFRPGRGLPAVRRAIRALEVAEPFDAAELCLALVIELCAHEPWDDLDHGLLEPLFDALRVVSRVPATRRPKPITKVAEAEVAVRHGDVRVRGDLELRGALLVTGSLTVSGAIHALGAEWSSGTLVVLGDVSAQRMSCLGPCAIGGTLALSQGLITAYYHDTSSSLVAHRITAPIWFDRGDIGRRVHGAREVPIRLRAQAWIEKRLPEYFEGSSRKVDWEDFDAAFYRRAIRAANQ
jgi:hypothetical protein